MNNKKKIILVTGGAGHAQYPLHDLLTLNSNNFYENKREY